MFRDDTKVNAPTRLTRGGPLDALRFLAAFCMVIYHYSTESPVPLARLHPVFERGYLATDFFLIVSGYVMGRIYGDRVVEGRIGTGTFFLRRAGRLVPAHLMMCFAFVLLVLATTAVGLKPLHPEWLDWRQLPGQALLIQSLGPFGGKGWNAPSWSLSALLACYLTFPILWRALRRLGGPVAVLAVGVLGLAGADLLTRRFLGYPVYEMPMAYGAIRALPLFLLGAALAVCSEAWVMPARTATGLGLGALALLVLVQASPARHDFLSIALIALVVLAAGAASMRKPSKLLEKAALVSFALFITNELVRVVYFGVEHALAGRLGLGQHAQWALWFGSLGAAVMFAVAFHYLVDWPSQGWIKPRLATFAASLKRGLDGLLPVPDPDFQPFRTNTGGTGVREIVLQTGPTPGAVHRPEGTTTLVWG